LRQEKTGSEVIVQIDRVDYTHSPVEIEEMRCVLLKSYESGIKPFNWRLALLENWIFGSRYLEPLEYFTSRVQLWRNKPGELVAFVIRGANYTNLQIDPDYRFLENDIFEWAEHHPLNQKTGVTTMVYDWDIQRQELLSRRGYRNQGASEDLRIFDLNLSRPDPVLPDGYRFSSVAEHTDSAKRVDLENRVWGVSLTEAWLRGKQSSPSYSPELDLLVVSPEEKLAAFSLVWMYPQNQTAEIDPIGTDPDFRQQGLARALVSESFRRMRQNGARYAYIGSDAEDPVVSRLHASFLPVKYYQAFLWSKPPV
jgi:ribosomal protein S18 acetylase RimI-like enzyme